MTKSAQVFENILELNTINLTVGPLFFIFTTQRQHKSKPSEIKSKIAAEDFFMLAAFH